MINQFQACSNRIPYSGVHSTSLTPAVSFKPVQTGFPIQAIRNGAHVGRNVSSLFKQDSLFRK